MTGIYIYVFVLDDFCWLFFVLHTLRICSRFLRFILKEPGLSSRHGGLWQKRNTALIFPTVFLLNYTGHCIHTSFFQAGGTMCDINIIIAFGVICRKGHQKAAAFTIEMFILFYLLRMVFKNEPLKASLYNQHVTFKHDVEGTNIHPCTTGVQNNCL